MRAITPKIACSPYWTKIEKGMKMTRQRNASAVRNFPRSYRLLSLGAILLLILISGGLLFIHAHSIAAQSGSGSFTFTAAGDYAQTTQTTASLKTIAQSGASFHLALGDIDESTTDTAAQWSSFIKSQLPSGFPFEIIPGDHDTSQSWATYTADLPDKMGSTGSYGQQYYFNYPRTAPLARFIMISPGQTSQSYNKGSSGYKWVTSAITSARTAGIHWVIVGLYENCFSLGSAHCSTDDILNLLVSQHVDLVLYAHKHDYEASKQLAFNGTSCTSLTTSYNANCVVNATSTMTRGNGTVIVIDGTAGINPQLSISQTDPAFQYFRASNGRGSNTTWGVMRISVSPTQLSEKFVPDQGLKGSGTFSDSFTING